jgi:hypothetical protein
MKKKSAIVAAAMLLAGVATANAQQDTSRAGQKQQAAADTSAQVSQQGDSIKMWGKDSAPPSGQQGQNEQDAVSKKNAAGQTDTTKTGTPKTRADSVSGQGNPSGAQKQQSSSDTSSSYSNPSSSNPSSSNPSSSTSPSSSSYSNPSSSSGSTTTPTTPTSSSRKMTKEEQRAERDSWFRNVSDVGKDQEISKNAAAPAAGAASMQQSSNTPDASQQAPSGTDASVQRTPEQSPQDARQDPAQASGNQNPQAEYTDSTRRYVPRDSAQPQSSTGSYSTPTGSQTSGSTDPQAK